ncbi:unnamed protein product [Leptidea sinapis]|uniref:AB hydrolase-1 domain-containing protein n=1 Tax=Leptidea sinapis TaxID=189913 RepID=A0A5E4R3L8_9NEOP|nr:unnamed protein product [Leptidea sinapis]
MDLIENEWFIEAPWGRISIVAWGNCYDPPVLLTHGVADTAASFKPLVRLLPRNYYYIAMEFPGNGKSDWFPRGLPLSTFEFVYAVHRVVSHFRWESFIFIGHSFGCLVGKTYNLCYPGKIRLLVEFDSWVAMVHITPEIFSHWYKNSFRKYFDNYEINNAPKGHSKLYKREEALQRLMDTRGIKKENAEATLQRLAIPAGDGLVRFSYDRRMKSIVTAPYNKEQVIKLYTIPKTPTLTILVDRLKERRFSIPFLLEESSYPHRNVRVRWSDGSHDVHFDEPERVAPLVSQFLLYGLKGLDEKAKI